MDLPPEITIKLDVYRKHEDIDIDCKWYNYHVNFYDKNEFLIVYYYISISISNIYRPFSYYNVIYFIYKEYLKLLNRL
jgi:hypothetical protein